MANDEIPDLFGEPSAKPEPRAAAPQAARPAAAPQAAQPRAAAPQAAAPQTAAPQTAAPTPAASVRGPANVGASSSVVSDEGLELEEFSLEPGPQPSRFPGTPVDPPDADPRRTAIVGTPSDDELEFDPTSIRRPEEDVLWGLSGAEGFSLGAAAEASGGGDGGGSGVSLSDVGEEFDLGRTGAADPRSIPQQAPDGLGASVGSRAQLSSGELDLDFDLPDASSGVGSGAVMPPRIQERDEPAPTSVLPPASHSALAAMELGIPSLPPGSKFSQKATSTGIAPRGSMSPARPSLNQSGRPGEAHPQSASTPSDSGAAQPSGARVAQSRPLDGDLNQPERAAPESVGLPPLSVPSGPQTRQAPPAAGPDPSVMGNLGADLGPPGWDLDDDFGDNASGMSQLNVAVPQPEADDIPWPSGRTPYPDDLTIDADEVQKEAGLGPPPGLFGTPMYFLRALAGLRQLEDRVVSAEKHLKKVEHARDLVLAKLATDRRGELENNDRFRSLFAEADKYDEMILERKRALAEVNEEGAKDLQDIELKIEVGRVERGLRQHQSAAQGEVRDRGRQGVERARGTIRRIEIETRNVVERARKLVPVGAVMPPDLGERFLYLESEKKEAEAQLKTLLGQQKRLDGLYEQAEDEHRRAFAALQSLEETKEGLMIAHEGEMTSFARALDEAKELRLAEIAKAGVGILELRGEVKVERETRLTLNASDVSVLGAATALETLTQARGSFDKKSYDTGKSILIGVGVGALALFVYAAIF